jgi:hypothetical protein
MPYGLLSYFVFLTLAGCALLYLYKKSPAPKRLHRCFRICGAFLVAGGVSLSSGVFFVLFMIRFHIAVGFPLVTGVMLVVFLILISILMISSRPPIVSGYDEGQQ